MPVALTLLAVAAGLIWGELSRSEDPRVIWLVAGGVLGLFGLLAGFGYLGSLAVLRRAEKAQEAESALAGTTTYRTPGQEDGWRVRMALVGLLGAGAALFAGYAAYRAVRDGGAWTMVALVAPIGGFAAGAMRAQIIPSSVQAEAKELMTQKWVERAGAENVVVEDEHGVETRLAGLDALRDSGEITAEEHARERRRILEEI